LVSAARLAYTANWQLTRRWLPSAAGRRIGRGLGLPQIGEPRFLSLVARLPPEVAQSLVATTQPLRGAGSEHYAYPAGTIHLTILGFAVTADVEDEVRQIVRRHRPFAVDVRGLNTSPRTVFAELYPQGGGLLGLRRDLRAALIPLHGPPSRWLRHGLAHANVLRFGAPVGASLIEEVARLRTHDFGRFEVTEIELVRTDKVLSVEGTRLLRRLALQGLG
jgi:2'-5' RNA ligase